MMDIRASLLAFSFTLLTLSFGRVAIGGEHEARLRFETSQRALDRIKSVLPAAPTIAASVMRLQNMAAAASQKTPPAWRTTESLLGRTKGGTWMVDDCADAYIPPRVNASGLIKITSMDKKDSSAMTYSFGSEEEARANKFGTFQGLPSPHPNGQKRSKFTFSLQRDAWTLLTIKGTDRSGQACHTTVKILRQGDELEISRVADKKIVLGDDIKTDTAVEQASVGQTSQPSPQPAQALTQTSHLPVDANGVRDILNASGGGDGVQPIQVAYPNGAVGRVWPAQGNGYADDFDGDCAGPGNMCQQFAERACSVLRRRGIGCRQVWFIEPLGGRHAVIAAETQSGWQYVEPQLNRSFGLPNPYAAPTQIGGIYHQIY